MEERDIVKTIASKSGIGLILTAAVSLIVVAVLKGWYFYQIFEHFRSQVIAVFLPVSIAIASQLIRFVFLLSSAKDLARGNMLGAALGGVASIGMIVYEISEAHHWVAYWSAGNAQAATPLFYAFCFLILSALFCEGRLCIALLPEKYTVRKAEMELREAVTKAQGENATLAKMVQELAAFKAEIEAEKQRIEQEKSERQRAERQRAEQEKDRELKRLQEQIRQIGNDGNAGTGGKKEIEQEVKRFREKHSRTPTQNEIAEVLGISPRTLRLKYPNGSWQTLATI